MENKLDKLQKRFGLDTILPLLLEGEREIGFKGQRVLCVGSPLPQELVIDELGAAQWTTVSGTRLERFGLSGDPGKSFLPTALENEEVLTVASGSYVNLPGSILQIPHILKGRFDRVVSFDTLHQEKAFRSVLTACHEALKADGIGYLVMQPQWASREGHALSLCEQTRAWAQIIPPWGHLLMSAPEMSVFLQDMLNQDDLARLIYQVYHNPVINRYFPEDYAGFFEATGLTDIQLVPVYEQEVPEEIQKALETGYPGKIHFAWDGLAAVFKGGQITVDIDSDSSAAGEDQAVELGSATDTTERNVLIFMLSEKEHYREKMVSDNEVFCGPDCQDLKRDGRWLTMKTDAGVYDVGPLIERLPASQKPDLVVVKADCTRRNFPVGLSALNCPKVLILGNTQHLQDPIQSLLLYAGQESFDYIINDHKRHHLHFFSSLFEHDKLFWLPGFNINPHPVKPNSNPDQDVVFVGQVGDFHPYRKHLVEALMNWEYPFQTLMAPQEQAAQTYRDHLISLNISLNGDLNLRIFEVMASGGFLLTDRLSPQSGLYEMFEKGKHFDDFGDLDELKMKIEYYFDHPEKARAMARTGYETFWKHHTPELKIATLLHLVDTGALPGFYQVGQDPRSLYSRSSDVVELEARVTLYEFIQQLHLLSDRVDAVLSPLVPAKYASDLVDLPRLHLERVSGSDDDREVKFRNHLEKCQVSSQIRSIAYAPGASGKSWHLGIFTRADFEEAEKQATEYATRCERFILICQEEDRQTLVDRIELKGFPLIASTDHFVVFE